MEGMGFPNDDLDSVMLPVGYTLTLWSDDGLTGNSMFIDGMEDADGRMVCQSFPDEDIGDATTSF